MFSPTIALTALLIELQILLLMTNLIILLHPRVLHNLKDPATSKGRMDADVEAGRGDANADVQGKPCCNEPGLGIRVVEEA